MTVEGILPTLASSVTRAPWGWVLTVAVVLAVIKAWPSLALTAAKAREKLREEKRGDLKDCTKKLAAMSDRIGLAEKRIATFEVRLMAALSAFDLVDTELAVHDAGSSARMQARILLRTAFHTDTANEGIEAILAKLDVASAH